MSNQEIAQSPVVVMNEKKLSHQAIEKLKKDHLYFQSRLDLTTDEENKQLVASLREASDDKAFIEWALMKIIIDEKDQHAIDQNNKIIDLQEQINEMSGRGHEVILERDELQAHVDAHCPDFESKLKWAVGIADEPESPMNFTPALSKSIAQRVVARYKESHNNWYDIQEIADAVNECIVVQLWPLSDDEYEKAKLDFCFDEDWFKVPLYCCKDLKDIDQAFKAKDIVECTHNGKTLITSNIEEAKVFFGM